MGFVRRLGTCCHIHWNGWFYFFSPLLILPLIFLEPVKELRTIFVILWCFLWFAIEICPSAIVGLLPIVLLPPLGVIGSNPVCMSYCRDNQFLLLCCMFTACAIETTGVSKRYAVSILSAFSCNPTVILILLMFVSYVLAAFIPITVLGILMMPLVKSILQNLEDIKVSKVTSEVNEPKDDEYPYPSKITNAFYIGVAYAMNIGSLSTALASDSGWSLRDIVKNNTNVSSLNDNLHTSYSPISFGVSLLIFIFVLLNVLVIFMGFLRPNSSTAQQITYDKEAAKTAIDLVKTALPPLNIQMFLVIILYFVSWILVVITAAKDIQIGGKIVKYSASIMLICFFYYVLPNNCDFCNYFRCKKPKAYETAPSVLRWNATNKMTPWRNFLVYGCSSALANVMKKSKIEYFIGKDLITMKDLSAQQMGFVGLTMLLGIMGDNTLVSEMMLKMGAEALGENKPAVLMYPITWATCLGFLLPMSSAGNLFAFGWGNLRARDFVLAGAFPTIIGFLIIILMSKIL